MIELEIEEEAEGRWGSLFVLTSVYVVGELSHFLLGIVSRPMAREIGYGDKWCLPNSIATLDEVNWRNVDCYSAKDNDSCNVRSVLVNSSEPACVWDYSGLGLEYQILAGPAFIAVFTICGIITGMMADRLSRRLMVGICLLILSAATTFSGAATKHWHLVVLRMAIGAGESVFTPACSSMISDMFAPRHRGLAMGIFNWGIYFGYGLSYAIGNFVTQADIAGLGWRCSYYLSGALAIFVLVLFCVIVKEPSQTMERNDVVPATEQVSELLIGSQRSKEASSSPESSDNDRTLQEKGSFWSKLIFGKSGFKRVFEVIGNLPFLLLTLSACIRHTAGFTWAYNTQLYFSTYYPSYNLGIWITAVSIIGGALGVASGGFVSDKLVKKLGLTSRIYVLAASQFLAAPFAIGVLYFSPPRAFYSLLGSYLFAEMWFGVLFAALLELIPSEIQSTSIALFLFVMNNVGGNAPVLLKPLREITSYHTALLILYPGFYLISSVLFFITSLFIRSGNKISRRKSTTIIGN